MLSLGRPDQVTTGLGTAVLEAVGLGAFIT